MASIFASILRIYYRMVTDVDGHADFAKTMPPFGGLGSSAVDVLFKKQILSPETCIDLCAIFGTENRDLLSQLITKMAEQHPSLRDEMIGCMATIWQKLEEVTKHLQEITKTAGTSSKRQAGEFASFLSDPVPQLFPAGASEPLGSGCPPLPCRRRSVWRRRT